MRTEDMYPSTEDMPLIAGGQDEILIMLTTARERVLEGHTSDDYIEVGADGVIKVCAIGAVIVADDKANAWGSFEHDNDGPNKTGAFIEQMLSETAKECIRLLNEETVRQFPRSADCGSTEWCGPFEWVNQSYFVRRPDDNMEATPEAQEAILGIYDAVIDSRTTVVA